MENKHFQRTHGDGLEDVIAGQSQGRGERVWTWHISIGSLWKN